MNEKDRTGAEDIFEGPLKQQSIDQFGLFQWNKRHFRVCLRTATFEVCGEYSSDLNNPTENKPLRLTLRGAKYAKEWATVPMITESGFDIFFSNGNAWSFMAEDAKTSQTWVRYINRCILICGHQRSRSEISSSCESLIDNEKSLSQNDGCDKNFNTIKVGPSSEIFTSPISEVLDNLDNKTINSQRNRNRISTMNDDNNQNFDIGLSAIAVESSSNNSSNKSSPDNLEAQPITDSPTYPRRSLSEGVIKKDKTNKKLNSPTSNMLKNIEEHVNVDEDNNCLPIPPNNPLKHQQSLHRNSLLPLRTGNEFVTSMERKEFNSRLERQRYFEITAEKEEVLAEKSKVLSLLHAERRARERAENESELFSMEIVKLKTKITQLEVDLERSNRQSQRTIEELNQENKQIRSKMDKNLKDLMKERDTLILQIQDTATNRIENVNLSFDKSVKEIERSIEHRLQREMELEKLQMIATLQQKYGSDIEDVKAKCAQELQDEVTKVRQVFIDREQQTIRDLKQLESLHAERVARLERQIEEMKTRVDAAEEQVLGTNENFVIGNSKMKQQSIDQINRLKELSDKSEQLQVDLNKAYKEIQLSRSREVSYRDQLTAVLEEARIQNAEIMELKRTTSRSDSQIAYWKKLLEESIVRQEMWQAELAVSKDEIAMLENETRRLTENNFALKLSLEKAERLVYGKLSAENIKPMPTNCQTSDTFDNPSDTRAAKNNSLRKEYSSPYSRIASTSSTSHLGAGQVSNNKSISNRVVSRTKQKSLRSLS